MRRELGDGLVLRAATASDSDAIGEMLTRAFANPDTGEPDVNLGGWARDLMRGGLPTFQPSDFYLVEDTARGVPVSCVAHISQTWTCAGIPFGVGRAEPVATDAAYRRRGLVRELMRAFHAQSAARGELVQGITGIPYYYKQFGYEYALELVEPRTLAVPHALPKLEDGRAEPYCLRPATEADIAFVTQLYARGAERSLVHAVRDSTLMRAEQFSPRDPLSGRFNEWDVVENSTSGERVGVVGRRGLLHRGHNNVFAVELVPSVPWQDALPSILRELARTAASFKSIHDKPFSALEFYLSANHPLLALWEWDLTTPFPGYAWYIRVADLPGFIMHIRPELERRLANSAMAGHSGVLLLNFYRDGMALEFERGKLCKAEAWQATAGDWGQKGFGNAQFPDLTFLQLVFGYRSRQELEQIYPDVLMDNDRTAALLSALFPKLPSSFMPIG